MAEYNALGSEKLKGDEKLKRILELTYFNTNNKETSTNTKAEYIKESKTGGVYGIIKEKDGYYVKKGLNENSLEYIGGMFMKNKNKFKSYAEALKRLDLISGQEVLNEEKKYVLKQNKPKEEASFVEPSLDAAPPVDSAPAPEPSLDTAPEGDMSTDVPSSEPSIDTDSTTESKRSDYMAEIQKFAGKLGQELRDQHDRMESDDIKYVLNMIISAVNLDVLDPDDLDDIVKKFEPKEDESSDFTDDEIPDDEIPDDEISETMDMLNDITNSSFDDEEIDFDGLDFEDTEELQEFDINSDLDNAPDYKPDYVSPKFLKYFADKSTETDELDEDETFGDEDEIVEFDLESITKDINDNVVTTLKKYFK